MIKNIIFDLGGVVLKYDIKSYLTFIDIPKEEQEIYKKLIWASEEWQKGDSGNITYEEIIENLCNKYPTDEKIRYILENKNNDILLSEITESVEYIKDLKNRGYKIYFLSNVSKWDIEYNIKRFEFFKLQDGSVYSCDIKCIKPDKDCYYSLLNKYNLKAEECIFIDDIKANIEAANKIGINGILFDTISNVKEKVEKIINKK